jgi:hypothetical protein
MVCVHMDQILYVYLNEGRRNNPCAYFDSCVHMQ